MTAHGLSLPGSMAARTNPGCIAPAGRCQSAVHRLAKHRQPVVFDLLDVAGNGPAKLITAIAGKAPAGCLVLPCRSAGAAYGERRDED
jgi:hypothetical protein